MPTIGFSLPFGGAEGQVRGDDVPRSLLRWRRLELFRRLFDTRASNL